MELIRYQITILSKGFHQNLSTKYLEHNESKERKKDRTHRFDVEFFLANATTFSLPQLFSLKICCSMLQKIDFEGHKSAPYIEKFWPPWL